MKLRDSLLSYATPTIALPWLQEALAARAVNVRIVRACLREFVLDADATARKLADGPTGRSYMACLREQIEIRAEFIRVWTLSDDRISEHDQSYQPLVSIARKYALPRPWKLSVPVAYECRGSKPTYLYWASAS